MYKVCSGFNTCQCMEPPLKCSVLAVHRTNRSTTTSYHGVLVNSHCSSCSRPLHGIFIIDNDCSRKFQHVLLLISGLNCYPGPFVIRVSQGGVILLNQWHNHVFRYYHHKDYSHHSQIFLSYKSKKKNPSGCLHVLFLYPCYFCFSAIFSSVCGQ